MELVHLADLAMTYRSLEVLDYGLGAGGQIYGTLEGTFSGDRLAGSLRLTNLAGRRPDDVNLPTVRGVLTTADGATVWVELDGVALRRAADDARVFVAAVRFRTGAEHLRWLNTVLGTVEGVLDTVGVGGTSHGAVWECRPTVT